jgi:CRP/FNR family transcriptional regulator
MKTDRSCIGCDVCNSKSPLFSALTREELEILNRDRYSVRFNKGEVILKQGTKANYLLSLIEGFAKIYIEGNHGRNLVLDFANPPRIMGGPGAQMEGRHKYSVIAIRETLVCFIDLENFRKVFASSTKFAEQFLIHCSGNYLAALDRMVGISQKQMHGRMADALIYLSEKVYKSKIIGDEISRQDIAEYTSMSKDSAIRVLKEFERDQILGLNGRQIEVMNPNRLYDIADIG